MTKTSFITVSYLSRLQMHTSNGGNKVGGNRPTLKWVDDLVIISGQMLRRSSRDNNRILNSIDPIAKEKGYFVSYAESPSYDISKDIGADLFGYLNVGKETKTKKGKETKSKKGKSVNLNENDENKDCKNIDEGQKNTLWLMSNKRRFSPIGTAFAVANDPSYIYNDLLTGYKENSSENTLVEREISVNDEIRFLFSLNCTRIGGYEIDAIEMYKSKTGNPMQYVIDEEERIRRAKLFLQSIMQLKFAGFSRNLAITDPYDIIIELGTKPIPSYRAGKYFNPAFNLNEKGRQNLIEDMKSEGSTVIFGSDNSDITPIRAMNMAIEHIQKNGILTL